MLIIFNRIEGKYQDVLVRNLSIPDVKTIKDGLEMQLPTLSSIRWRVDVDISTSTLNRVLEPSILLNLTTNKGDSHIFGVNTFIFLVMNNFSTKSLFYKFV